ncbi:hypothetical protein B296_00015395 [Ensete ventricosum]|uniref:Uncharacterized protein n=1 Tax=Ensete ventricosum TaxID=4639 RepID=A0A426ZQN7_ENSVE|nr:hypothetical protein B296_00015395 [Ensete ventricosum]
MLGRSQVRPSGRGSNNTVRTRHEIVGSSPKVIGSLPGIRRELTKGDQELAGSTSGVHLRMPKSSSGCHLPSSSTTTTHLAAAVAPHTTAFFYRCHLPLLVTTISSDSLYIAVFLLPNSIRDPLPLAVANRTHPLPPRSHLLPSAITFFPSLTHCCRCPFVTLIAPAATIASSIFLPSLPNHHLFTVLLPSSPPCHYRRPPLFLSSPPVIFLPHRRCPLATSIAPTVAIVSAIFLPSLPSCHLLPHAAACLSSRHYRRPPLFLHSSSLAIDHSYLRIHNCHLLATVANCTSATCSSIAFFLSNCSERHHRLLLLYCLVCHRCLPHSPRLSPLPLVVVAVALSHFSAISHIFLPSRPQPTSPAAALAATATTSSFPCFLNRSLTHLLSLLLPTVPSPSTTTVVPPCRHLLLLPLLSSISSSLISLFNIW